MTLQIKTISELKDKLKQCNTPLGLVPTMGALHEGHISLIKKAKEECKTVVVYVFVNPLQFGANEDFTTYPRDLESDLKICRKLAVDYIFTPTSEEIYPDLEEAKTNAIHPPEALRTILCGKTREGHFSGVATVIKRFIDIVQPHNIYFGEKDLQQLYVINWLIKKYNLPTTVKPCPTIRESSGLACSSRNQYLSKNEKLIAAALYKALKLAKQNTRSGIFTIKKAILESLIFLSQFPEIKVDYFEARNKEDLSLVADNLKNGFYYLIAAKINNTRLIDNIEV